MVYVFTLPNGRQCRAGVYVDAWKALKKIAPDSLVPGFGHFTERANDILAAMRGGLSGRINRHDRSYGVGRKWASPYQIQLWRDSRRLRDIASRIRVYQFETEEARSRFSDRLARHDD